MEIPDSLALKIAPAATENGVCLSPEKKFFIRGLEL